MKVNDFAAIFRSTIKRELTPEDEAMIAAIGAGVEKAFQEESVERNKQLAVIAEKMGTIDDGENMAAIVRQLASTIDTIKASQAPGLSSLDKYNLKRKLEEKREEIERSVRDRNPWAIEFKAVRAASAMMQTTTVLTGAQAVNTMNVYDDLEVVVIQYPANFILDAIDSRQVTKVPQTLRYKVQKAVSDGVPTAVNEAGLKPLTDKSFEWKYSTRTKYAGRIEFTEETEMDFEQLLLKVIAMFEQDVLTVYQDAVLAAVTAYAPEYTTTALDGTFVIPNIYGAIGACQLWVRDHNYEPNVVIMNPGDAAKATYLQDANGQQLFIPDSLRFAGLRPFLSNKVPVGTIIVGTSSTIKEQHGNFILRRGMYGEQFIYNESTIVGEIFSILEMPTLAQNSWVKFDVATQLSQLEENLNP